MLVVSQTSDVEILTPKLMVLGGDAFGWWLGHEGRALMNGISVLVKETPEDSLPPSTMWGYSKKITLYERGSGPSPGARYASALILDFQLPGLWEIYLLFKHPVYGVFVVAARMDRDRPSLHCMIPTTSPPGTCAGVLPGSQLSLLSGKSCLLTSACPFPYTGIRSPFSELLSWKHHRESNWSSGFVLSHLSLSPSLALEE